MNPLWNYLWPVFSLGLSSSGVSVRLPSRLVLEGEALRPGSAQRRVAFAAGAVLSIAGCLWQGRSAAPIASRRPLNGAFTTSVDNEMTRVTAKLHHDPLTRDVLLSGPADDFQRSELVRLIDRIPGVGSARWSADGGGLPLIVEGCVISLLGFLLGLLLAYLVELRRRYNSQWNW